MPSPAALADRLVSSLCKYFGDRLPPQLGREAYALIKKQLRADGFADNFHAEEVLSMALTDAIRYLNRHQGDEIRQPRAWFHTLCTHACAAYLKEIAVQTSCTLSSVLDGEIELSEGLVLTEESTLAVIREAIEQLRPRHRQLIVLDLVECLPPAAIREAMQLPTSGAFRKLKHEAFMALREAIRALINGGIGRLLS